MSGAELTVRAYGQDRTELLEKLELIEASLHQAMREMREGGASQVEVMAASGYRSIDAVRKILDPAVKAGAAEARKRRRQAA